MFLFFRNEKIRTYNYHQDRITDHRVKLSTSGIESFMEGGEKLTDFLHDLMREDRKDRLDELIREGLKEKVL